ncbi:MAG TPA: alpha/beta fold hydrolase [Symbiobacteriaceae bacterium]|nr:alpha/beta fold hydrolase [Symbiobacteriaceae bacterium]
MSTFVLVHGAFHGGWCWTKVVPQLVQAGHHVVALDLPAHGEDTTPISELTLETQVSTVVRVIQSRKEPVILVGHSFGGVIVSQAAEQVPGLVKSLVYLTAMVPKHGQCGNDLLDPASQLGPSLILNQEQGYGAVRTEMVPFLFYNDCSAEDIAFAKAHIVNEPLLPTVQTVTLTTENYGRLPKTYIECTLDNTFTLAFQRQMQAQTPCQVQTLEAGHSPFFSKPAELAALLLAAAAQPANVL